jgi:hypothetical protein
MAGILAIVAFIMAFFLKVANLSSGVWDWTAIMLLGLVFLAIHCVRDWWPGR